MAPRFKTNAFHIELAEFLRTFGWATGQQASLWTGAHGSTVKKALYRMRQEELVERSTVTSYTTASGAQRVQDLVLVSVWHLTKRGMRVLGPIEELPGSGARLNTLPVIRSVGQSSTISHHLAVVDHCVVARVHGARVAAERQIRATEQEVAKTGKATAGELRRTRFWVSVAPDHDARWGGTPPTHTPDAGWVWPNGAVTAAEIELARKSVKTYQDALRTAYTSGLPTWWFPMQRGARENLIEASKNAAPVAPVTVDGRVAWWGSADDMIRIYPSLWNGGWNSDLASFDPRAIYASMLSPVTGSNEAGQRIDPRRYWMTRPDVATLAQKTKAARKAVTAQSVSQATAPAVGSVPALPPLAERVAILRAATDGARATALAPGAYAIGSGLAADWDGAVFSGLRAA